MDQVNNVLDSVQQSLNSVTSLWTRASELFGSVAGGSQTVGGIILAVLILGAVGLATYIGANVLGG